MFHVLLVQPVYFPISNFHVVFIRPSNLKTLCYVAFSWDFHGIPAFVPRSRSFGFRRQVEALGAQALPYKLDVRDDAAVEAMAQAVVAKFGRFDIVL